MSTVADSETSKLLRLLADLGADAKQTRKFLTLFDGKPSPPIIAPEASGVVFSEGMAKKKKRGEGPYIDWRPRHLAGKGATARVTIYQDVCFPDGIGKHNVQYPLGKVTWEEARRMAKELKEKQAPGSPPVALIAVEQFITGYYYPNHVATLRKGGQKTAHEILPHLIQAYGKRPLRSLTVIDVQRMLNLKAQRYSRETVKKIRAQISGVYRWAMGVGTLGITVNPASLARVPARCAQTEKERITPQVVEAQKLRATLTNPKYSPLFEMATMSGTTTLGFSELAELRWYDQNLTGEKVQMNGVTLEPFTVSVARSYYRGEVGDCKNKGRQRVENLGEQVVEALLALKARSPFNQPGDLVFTRTGKHLDYHQCLRKLQAACREAGIRQLGWHSLRRYCATVMVGRITEEQRRRMMGHSSSLMTEHYTAEDVKARAAAVQTITDELFADPKDDDEKKAG